MKVTIKPWNDVGYPEWFVVVDKVGNSLGAIENDRFWRYESIERYSKEEQADARRQIKEFIALRAITARLTK